MILAPLELEAGAVGDQSFQVGLVQKVVHSFFVDLEVGAVDGELFVAGATLLLDHFEEEAD